MPNLLHFQEEAEDYGIDWFGPVPVNKSEDRVVIPDTPRFLNGDQLSALKILVDPLAHCDDFGKELYIATREFVREITG